MQRIKVAGILTVGLTVAVVLAGFALEGNSRRDRLRRIVQEQCVPHWLAAHEPAPCASVTLLGRGADAQGYAVLHDRKGGAHFLLIPTRTVGGIESPAARSTNAPNYFDAAWKARGVLAIAAGRSVPRTAIGLAVNPLSARSQDQLHIHMSCLRSNTFGALKQDAAQIGPRWEPIELAGHSYEAMRVLGKELAPTNPIRLLADGVPGARDRLADYTLLVAGAVFDRAPGFVVLASRSAPGAELLLDATCAVVR